MVIFLFDILILQPSFFKNFTKSRISGSIAQFDRTVSPLALKAANKAFSVAPTEIEGNLIFAPVKPFFASAIIYPSLIFIFAPSFLKQINVNRRALFLSHILQVKKLLHAYILSTEVQELKHLLASF